MLFMLPSNFRVGKERQVTYIFLSTDRSQGVYLLLTSSFQCLQLHFQVIPELLCTQQQYGSSNHQKRTYSDSLKFQFSSELPLYFAENISYESEQYLQLSLLVLSALQLNVHK